MNKELQKFENGGVRHTARERITESNQQQGVASKKHQSTTKHYFINNHG